MLFRYLDRISYHPVNNNNRVVVVVVVAVRRLLHLAYAMPNKYYILVKQPIVIDAKAARKRVTKTTGTNNMNNQWEDVRCSTLVDTRQFGGYCTVHRRQGLLSSSSSSNDNSTKAGGSTFMQRQRQESASSRITTTTVAPPVLVVPNDHLLSRRHCQNQDCLNQYYQHQQRQ